MLDFFSFPLLILQCFWIIGNVILQIIVLSIMSCSFLRMFKREYEIFWFFDLDDMIFLP